MTTALDRIATAREPRPDDFPGDPDALARQQARRTVWNAVDLLAADFPPTKFAIPGLVAEGVNLLVGPPKAGKSWAALNLAVSVATGGIAFGKIPVTEGDVLYAALEDTPRRLQTRLAKVLGPDPAPPRMTILTECPPLDEHGDVIFKDWLNRHPHARLVIVDVFARIRGRAPQNGSAYGDDYHAMSVIKKIADAWGVSFIVVHHTRKATSEDFLDTVSGTQGLAGAADAILVLSRARGQADGMLKVTGRDIDEAEYALTFAPDLGAWQMLDGPAADYTLADTRKTILDHLRDVLAGTPKQIAAATGLNYESVKKTCKRMADDNQLDSDGQGTYFPPNTPVSAVPAVPVPSAEGHGGLEGHPSQTTLEIA